MKKLWKIYMNIYIPMENLTSYSIRVCAYTQAHKHLPSIGKLLPI